MQKTGALVSCLIFSFISVTYSLIWREARRFPAFGIFCRRSLQPAPAPARLLNHLERRWQAVPPLFLKVGLGGVFEGRAGGLRSTGPPLKQTLGKKSFDIISWSIVSSVLEISFSLP